MIFFANAQGTITKVIQEPVYQGSHRAGRVVLVAPFPNSMVTVGFVLPNGVRTAVNLATPNMLQTDLTDIITPSGQKYNAWTYLLERSITEYAGKVAVQFFVTTGSNNQLLATYTSELTIQKGVPVVLPAEPTSTIYTQILEYLTRVETKLTNIIIPVAALPTENIDFNAIYLLNKNGNYGFYVYYTDISAWVRVDKAITSVTSVSGIVDDTKVYILTANDGNYTAGVYLRNGGNYIRLLTGADYDQINADILALANTLTEKETALQGQITALNTRVTEAVQIATTASNTASAAQSTAATAENNSEVAVQTATQANTTATTAETKAQQAYNKALEALNKAGSVTGVFTPKGNIASISDLPEPSAATLGWLYNITSNFTTTDQFVEGAGINYTAGENVAIIEPTTGVFKYDVFSGTVDLTTIESDIATLQSQMAELLYTPIVINSFSNNIGTQELGTTITAVNLSWSFSKTPESVTLDGVEKAVDSTGESLTGLSITANKTWTLRATETKPDGTQYTATRTSACSFYNGVYYGVATAPITYDSAFILSLTKTIRSNKLTSFTANAGTDQFIYYALPTRYGTCAFKVGGFDGGFTLVDTISFTNSKGYTENYYIYKSDNASLGETAVSVS